MAIRDEVLPSEQREAVAADLLHCAVRHPPIHTGPYQQKKLEHQLRALCCQCQRDLVSSRDDRLPVLLRCLLLRFSRFSVASSRLLDMNADAAKTIRLTHDFL
jgi:hypothetical protein